jgi:hypothetical protein
MGTTYYKQAGHCTRCEAAFGADATIFMVRESVVWEVHADGGGFAQEETVAVCEKCLKPQEQGQNHLDMICGGCGRRMILAAKKHNGQWRVSACSDRCDQRVRRKRGRELRMRWRRQRTCQCGQAFMPKRSDAIYCSTACKQRAYRRAHQDENGGSV